MRLSVTSLAAQYGQGAALHDVSLEVAEGEVIGLIGRNGMGKTSTLRAVMRWPEPTVTAGRITVDGTDLTRGAAHRPARIGLGYVPQGRMIFGSLTVEENLSVLTRAFGRATVRAGLTRVWDLFPKLADIRNRRASVLSGGEQQMLAIGRALVGQPRILLLDEPSEGLAPSIVDELTGAIRNLANDGVGILLAEQNLTLAVSLTDRLLVLEQGRVVLARDSSGVDINDPTLRSHLGV
ncbi:ABC transporter ATP-binding protein [Phytoactinopolyspora limicola]|uniref:ABC transporter ATP-binding protein n=1 Tax=Phytoactinopolyspora limicola TaxID=2715536 RepID=UPI00140C98A7|nr:ABC transporter ATP-binding protein [Phytoactinopolyspora limicola]